MPAEYAWMTVLKILLPFLIAAAAVPFGIFAGRAQASRMRELRDDISTGKLRGYLVILVVIIMFIATSLFKN
jgi:hypothetical protein